MKNIEQMIETYEVNYPYEEKDRKLITQPYDMSANSS